MELCELRAYSNNHLTPNYFGDSVEVDKVPDTITSTELTNNFAAGDYPFSVKDSSFEIYSGVGNTDLQLAFQLSSAQSIGTVSVVCF